VPGEEKILVTPSGIPYLEITPRDVLLVDFDGEPLERGRNPSTETPFHLAIYRNRRDVGGIVHSHSLYALAVAAAKQTVPVFLDELFANIGGDLAVTEYALPGSDELAEKVLKRLGDKNAVLLANHGAVCCGKDLDEAVYIAETVEKICHVFFLTATLGRIEELPSDGVAYQRLIYEMKKNL
jgi:L-fuculose-phosphate aldolase